MFEMSPTDMPWSVYRIWVIPAVVVIVPWVMPTHIASIVSAPVAAIISSPVISIPASVITSVIPWVIIPWVVEAIIAIEPVEISVVPWIIEAVIAVWVMIPCAPVWISIWTIEWTVMSAPPP